MMHSQTLWCCAFHLWLGAFSVAKASWANSTRTNHTGPSDWIHHTSSLRQNYTTTMRADKPSCSSVAPALMESAKPKFEVAVGARGELVFEPNRVDAGLGDVIRFMFLAKNHTLTQSTGSHPCTNIGGFSTGFRQYNPMNVSGLFVVDYVVDSLEPQWFFCAQTMPKSHCEAGMVFTLNSRIGDIASGLNTSLQPKANSSWTKMPNPPAISSLSTYMATINTTPSASPTVGSETPTATFSLGKRLMEDLDHVVLSFFMVQLYFLVA